MPNPRAQKQLALNSAVQELKTLGQPIQALGDMFAGTLRGSVAATAGLGGDIRELVDLLGPKKVEQLLGKRVLPTTEEMKAMLPKATSYDNPYESIGEFLPLPGSVTAAKAAGYGLGRGAGALTRATGQAVSDAMIHQAGPLASGPLSALAPRMAMTNVVKPKGGNWLSGSVENTVKPLKVSGGLTSDEIAQTEAHLAKIRPKYDLSDPRAARELADMERHVDLLKGNYALDKWVEGNLTGYMKNQMGTPEDPIRKLFETRTQDIEAKYAKSMDKSQRLEQRAASEADPRKAANFMRESQQIAENAAAERELTMKHIAHFPSNEIEFANAWIPEELGKKRFDAGYPATGMGNSPAAKAWETMADNAIFGDKAKEYLTPLTPSEIRRGYGSVADDNPWLSKVDPETMAYHPEGTPADLGLDHVIDILKQDVASGRIRPEQLNKVSMEDAVRRAAEVDLEMARKINDSKAAAREGLPVYKDYPEGYRWIELNRPGSFLAESEAMGHSVKGYEPPRGHADWVPESGDYGSLSYGHGGWDAIKAGDAKVYSLVNKKGEPHVTVESRTGKHPIGYSYKGNEANFPDAFDYNNDYLDAAPRITPEQKNAILNRARELHSENPKMERMNAFQRAANEVIGELPSAITQIKGKSNRMPNEEYLPYVQDFVRSGEWSDIDDLKNTGLIRHEGKVMTPAEYDDMLLKELTPPEEGMKAGGRVSISDNPDQMWMELEEQKFGVGGAVAKLAKESVVNANSVKRVLQIKDHAERAAEAQKLIEKMYTQGQAFDKNAEALRLLHKAQTGARSLPTVIPRARPRSTEEIREYAQRTADQLNAAQKGEFLRADAGESKNAAGKSFAQWKMEQELEHDIRPTGAKLEKPRVANIENQLGSLKMGISGDTTIADNMLHRAGKYDLADPVEEEGGALYGLRVRPKPVGWASNEDVLSGVQRDINLFSDAYGGVPVLGQYNSMGPGGTNFALHFARSNLNATDTKNMNPSKLDKFNEIVKKGNAASGAHPDFPGIQDPGAYNYLEFYPELRKYYNSLTMMPEITKEYGLPDGRVIHHAITIPDLRDMPVLTSGHSQFELVPGLDPRNLPLSEHGTYSHDLPRKEGAPVMQTPFPIPAELEFSDVKDFAEPMYKPEHMTRVYQTASPRQIIDQQHIDEIKAYEEFMRQYSPQSERKKKGGAVMMSKGGETPPVAVDNMAKLKAIREQLAPVVNAWAAKQAEDANKYTRDIQQFKLPLGKAAGGEISADDLILEERLL